MWWIKLKRYFRVCAFILSITLINVDARAYETKTDEQILAEMQQMQDRITETLIIEDNKYIYDYDTIKEIVDVYDFDEFNQVAGTNYTKESFLDIAMDSIENTDLTPQVIPTGICGQTWKIEGWNYVRTAQTKAVSNALVNDAKNYAEICRAGGTIGGAATAAVPAVAAILIAASALGVAYYNTFANNLSYQNSLSKCGTVIDINKFYFHYQIWNQANYNG